MNKDTKAIIFDLGNVLFDLDIPKTWRAMEKVLGTTFEHTFNYEPTREVMYAYERGLVDTGTFVGEIQKLAKEEVTPQQIVEAWNAMLMTMPKRRFDLLERLEDHFELYLLSNINTLHLEFFHRHLRDDHGILDWESKYFDRTFYSHHLGMRKPDSEIYEYVIDEIGHATNSLVFIDDNIHNIESAKKMDIQAFHLEEKAELLEMDIFENLI